MAPLKWEEVRSTLRVRRARVPGGWLVAIDHHAAFFYPDDAAAWAEDAPVTWGSISEAWVEQQIEVRRAREQLGSAEREVAHAFADAEVDPRQYFARIERAITQLADATTDLEQRTSVAFAVFEERCPRSFDGARLAPLRESLEAARAGVGSCTRVLAEAPLAGAFARRA